MKIVMFALFLSAQCELTTSLRRKHFHFTNKTTWDNAQTFCKAYYDDLSNLDSWEAIEALETASGGSYPLSWVGLNWSTFGWEWSGGGNNSFIIWKSGQPDKMFPCAAVDNGELDDKNCNETHPYFCYKWDSSVSELIVVKENKSWEDALQYCRTHHTDLASLPTNLTQDQKNTAETSSVWTGLRFLAGSWFWLSGEDLGYLTVQLPACPANYTYCGSLNLINQSWENRNCMEKLNFVCY